MRLAHPGEETAQIRNPNLEILTASGMPFQGKCTACLGNPEKACPAINSDFGFFSLRVLDSARNDIQRSQLNSELDVGR